MIKREDFVKREFPERNRDEVDWQYLRDDLDVELAEWTDEQLDSALADDGFLGLRDDWNCYVE